MAGLIDVRIDRASFSNPLFSNPLFSNPLRPKLFHMQTDDWDEHDGGDDNWVDDEPDEGDDWSDDFDYDSFIDQNFPNQLTNTQTSPIWRWVSVVLLIVFAFSIFASLF